MNQYTEVLTEPVSDLPLRDMFAVSPDRPVREVVTGLQRRHVGCAAVVDDDGKPLGLFTDKVLVQMLSDGVSLDEPVGDHLIEDGEVVSLTDPVSRVFDAMCERSIRYFCVVDEAGKAVALTGQKGLLELFAVRFPHHVQRLVYRIGQETIARSREGSLESAGASIMVMNFNFDDPLENYDSNVSDDPLEKALAEESVSHVSSTPFTVITPETTIRDAIQTLSTLQIACMMVARDHKLIGMFSEYDVLTRVGADYENLADRPVSEVMTPNPFFVRDSDSVAAALSVVAVCGYRHIPVLDENDQIVGIVSPPRIGEFIAGQVAG